MFDDDVSKSDDDASMFLRSTCVALSPHTRAYTLSYASHICLKFLFELFSNGCIKHFYYVRTIF